MKFALIIICAMGMRDGTGLELLQKLRQQGANIPFTLMSASDDYHLENKVQTLGCSFCCKTSHDLIEKIKAL